ncbi:MAG: hypothetical protein DDT32_02072 [Syntrophomonadaceae bacterium]|nr:hypothetical protein [Bacillota bacterium]
MEILFGGITILWLLMIGLGLALFVFWIMMFISAVKNQFKHKPLWIIILFIGNIIGAIAFYFVVHKPIKAAKRTAQPTQS